MAATDGMNRIPETDEARRARAAAIVSLLAERYPAECSLLYRGDPWRLLMMSILSAQCADARVNIVCETLFVHFPDAAAMAAAAQEEVERDVHDCGMYHDKARYLRESSAILLRDFGGEVPSDMDALLSLPGVGRKIANLIRGDIFKLPAVVTDTHCIRISGRLGLCEPGERNPVKVERALLGVIERDAQTDFCHRLVLFGRDICTARAPKCDICPLSAHCNAFLTSFVQTK